MTDPLKPGRSGRADGAPGLIVHERGDLVFASLIAARGREDALRAATHATVDIELPAAGHTAGGEGVLFVWSGPGRWLVQAARASTPDIETLLAPLAAHAAVCDLGDSRLVLDLAGPRVRAVLAKGLPLDLDPDVFTTGCSASSTINYIAVQLWQTGPEPVYRLAVPRSYGASFLDWLLGAAAEYGCERVHSAGN